MHGFEDVTLSWQGQSFTVPANKQMMLIAKIEDALVKDEDGNDTGEQPMPVLLRKGGMLSTKLAAAFGAALRYAGADVSNAEVYLSIQSDMISKSKREQTATYQESIYALMSIISPPLVAHLRGAEPATEATGKKT